MKAYCVKCKTKQKIKGPQAVFTSTGTPATRGVCSECGTNVFRMGRTEAHQGLPVPEKKARKRKEIKRKGNLVIVESPAKARTIGRFLGKNYSVKASVGHVRDLLKSKLSVDVENDFEPRYRVPNEKRPLVKELKSAARKAEEVFIATDPDREGEAIAWHLLESADIPENITHRVVFHEITKSAISDAFANPRGINMDLVDAQQARRILDRLVGYNLSPLLWRKVRGRLSAGRVQSVALRLVVEREREIEGFNPVEYWSIEAELLPEGSESTFITKLVRIDGEKPSLGSEEDVSPFLLDMERAKYQVDKIKRGTRRRKPAAPFVTSTLQREASRRFGFSARRTMRIAQQLYEGLDVGNSDSEGLITYMRTDSTHVSKLAQSEARKYILEQHGEKYLPEKPRKYKTKVRSAQEAHEAIRPTSVFRLPDKIKQHLSRDQFRMYKLIWQRFIGSQMSSAVSDTISIEVLGKSTEHLYLLRASGSTIRFPGFLVVYKGAKERKKDDTKQNKVPLDLENGQRQKLIRLIPDQHFTAPPPRFSEASLVKELEENGIGRPSTYAPIISTLSRRGYVEIEERRLFPTKTGFTVNDLISEHFPNIVDVGFTARMELDLDRIATGKQKWVAIIRDFYGPFSEQIKKAEKNMPVVKAEPESIGRLCPKCEHDLVIRWGRFGKFISCSNFPECRYTEPWLQKIGVTCPEDKGDIVRRKTRKGRVFYGCANYPDCEFTSWKRPLPVSCSNCGGLLVAANKRYAKCMKCEEQYPLDQIADEK